MKEKDLHESCGACFTPVPFVSVCFCGSVGGGLIFATYTRLSSTLKLRNYMSSMVAREMGTPLTTAVEPTNQHVGLQKEHI